MRKIDLTKHVYKQPDADGKVMELDVRVNLLTVLSHAAMKAGGDRVSSPYFPIVETPEEHRRIGKLVALLDEATDSIELSDERYELLKRIVEANPYRTTMQTVVLDRLDAAQEVEEAKG